MTPRKRDPEKWPHHMRPDEIKRNKNIDAGRTLCPRCDGTGNELWSMYRRCEQCDGKGYLED